MLMAALVSLLGQSAIAQPGPVGLPPVPVPPENPITESKRVLGKILFWEEQLSSDNTVACGTCHRAGSGSSDPRQGEHPGNDGVFGTLDDKIGSPGVARIDEFGVPVDDPVFHFEAQVTRRSAQPILMTAFSQTALWDGAAGGQFIDPESGATLIGTGGALESQAILPILSDVEMAHENRTWDDVREKLESVEPWSLATNWPADVAEVLADGPSYPELFDAAFGDSEINAGRIAFALATYERTLVPDQTPWDAFVKGDGSAFTSEQLQGWGFFSGSQCAICHSPPQFTNFTFRNIGLRPIPEDRGRFEQTGNPQDRGRFKVPTLRNVGLKPTFMHNGGVASGDFDDVRDVIDFYVEVAGHFQFPDNIDPIVPNIIVLPFLRDPLAEFLATGLTDPRVANEEFPFDRPMLRSEIDSVPGDCDGDGDVDLVDFSAFQLCFTGSSAGPVDSACVCSDFDRDGDVDLADFGAFQLAFGSAM
jgi:cytochrome c peroxidase